MEKNKFVRTKMRLKLGTKIDLSERFVRLICQICQILFSNDSMSFPRDFRDLRKTRVTVRHLYKRVYPSVGPSVVRPSRVFFKLRKSRGNDIESLEKKI